MRVKLGGRTADPSAAKEENNRRALVRRLMLRRGENMEIQGHWFAVAFGGLLVRNDWVGGKTRDIIGTQSAHHPRTQNGNQSFCLLEDHCFIF